MHRDDARNGARPPLADIIEGCRSNRINRSVARDGVPERAVFTDESRAIVRDPPARAKVEEEVADCFLFCVLMFDACGIDLIDAAQKKIALNSQRYPVEKSRGRRDKHDALG